MSDEGAIESEKHAGLRPGERRDEPFGNDEACDATPHAQLPVEPWPAYDWPAEPARIATPKWRDLLVIRALIIAAFGMLAAFLLWLFQPMHMGDPFLYWPLSAALILVVVGWLFEWVYYWQISAPPVAPPTRRWTVDVFTTACPGEPRGMIVRTLLAMKAIRYPHRNYLCDEGDDPILREVCEQLGINYVTRETKDDAKAGNINYGLKQSDGEICVVLDPDHEPAPYLLDRALGYFDDPQVGYVQTIQAYRNQKASLIARGAAEMSYQFYGPLMMGMHRFGTAQAIGANCVFRRKALDSIGGHAPGLAEDMHTAMRVFSKGWRSVYVPEALTRGLAPSTLAAFYKQQLKWSCGVFDLLFQVYPRLFRDFTWRQRLHFLLAPTYFLRGLIGLISLMIPFLCLIYSGIAWRISLVDFLIWALPLVALVGLVRQASQRFLLEPSERGLHLLSGALSIGTWWVFLLGNLCALLRIKIPYIPTPKEDHAEDAWRLATPNLIAAGLCVSAIIYGLDRDYSPYTLLMASFAGWNAAALLFITTLGQQRTLHWMRSKLKRLRKIPAIVHAPLRLGAAGHNALLGLLRQWSLLPALVVLIATGLAFMWPSLSRDDAPLDLPVHADKRVGGFYTGIYFPADIGADLTVSLHDAKERLGVDFRIVSIYQSWGASSLENFPDATLREICRAGAVPMITWEPWSHRFPQSRYDSDLSANRRIFAAILRGDFDGYIIDYATKLRDLGEPVLVRFAHEPDNPQYPWSSAGGNSPDEFAAAFRYVVDLFNEQGASNVGWVYSPWTSAAVERYYPGAGYVDWVGLTLLNYGKAAPDGQWRSFTELYSPFRPKLIELGLPVMLAEFGSTTYGGDQRAWLDDAMTQIESDHPEIQSLVFFHSDADANWITPWRPDPDTTHIDWTFLDHDDAVETVSEAVQHGRLASGSAVAVAHDRPDWNKLDYSAWSRSPSITGAPGRYRFHVDGRPFYIRGVAYNIGGDWRNGNVPPTRRQLETDFRLIRDMGANTIRRYGGGWYDRNILTVADEQDLKVLYGFWFDQKLDYLTETEKLREYEEQVIETVLAYRDHPALLGWTLGNEVWGLLAHRYSQPYLTHVRHAYVRFVERLAIRIHELDPDHPVITAHEHNHLLPGAMHDFAWGAPSLDAIGVNSYYEHNINQLAHIAWRFDRNRPYIVTEFGPEGYWHDDFTARDDLGLLWESSAVEKAQLYERRWHDYVAGWRGTNLGGVAFCWRDRYEGSSTWFGMTDDAGRRKPAYYALRRAWTGRQYVSGPMIDEIVSPYRTATPGSQITVHARIDAEPGETLTYDWSVVGEDYQQDVAGVSALNAEQTVQLTLPDEPGIYRIHLQVRGARGLDERSFPILVRDLPMTPTPLKDIRSTQHEHVRTLVRVHALDGR